MTTEERKQYMLTYRENNREKLRLQSKEYYNKIKQPKRTKLTEEEKKQKIKENNAKWRANNREKIKEININYRKKQKISKLNDLKDVNDKTIQRYQNRKIVENYPTKIKTGIDPDYLTYQIIICKGVGKLNKELTNLFIIMLDNIMKKFSYVNTELREDCRQHALLNIVDRYTMFNEHKYSNAFPYITEIMKRSLAEGYNLYNSTKYVSLSKFENYY